MAKKSGIREAGEEAKTFGSAAISATGSVLKSFARVLDRGAAAVGQATSAAPTAAPATKRRAAPKRTAKAAKKKPAAKRAAVKKKRASSRRKR